MKIACILASSSTISLTRFVIWSFFCSLPDVSIAISVDFPSLKRLDTPASITGCDIAKSELYLLLEDLNYRITKRGQKGGTESEMVRIMNKRVKQTY